VPLNAEGVPVRDPIHAAPHAERRLDAVARCILAEEDRGLAVEYAHTPPMHRVKEYRLPLPNGVRLSCGADSCWRHGG
jgi:hypothetical protein